MARLHKELLLLILLLASQVVFSQLRIEITGGTDDPIRVAVVPIQWNLEIAPRLYLHEVIKNDLESFGEFYVLKPDEMLSYPTSEEDVYFRDWKLLLVDYLIVGTVLPDQDQDQDQDQDSIKVNYSIIDVSRKKVIHKSIISGSAKFIKRIGHNISDKIYEQINGLSGIFSTRIAYVDKPAGTNDRYDLRITDLDGDNNLSLFSSPQPILSPAWSPSGNELAYVSFEEGTSRIFLQELSTGKRKPLRLEKGINSSPSWSPDGKYLAGVLSKSGNPDIYIYDLSKDAWEQQTDHYGIDTEPDWSKNGNFLIFTSNRSGSPQIYELNVKNKRVKRTTFEGTYNARARYLPGGKNIIYIHRRQGVFHVAMQNLKTGKITILTDTFLDESPSVSPNGNIIIYATKDGNRDVLAGVTINGKTKFRLPSVSGGAREPAWSP
jgi:TolB protein